MIGKSITFADLPEGFRQAVDQLAAAILEKNPPAEQAVEVAAEARRIVEAKMQSLPALELRAIAATIVEPDATITPAELANRTGDALGRIGELVETEILRRVAA